MWRQRRSRSCVTEHNYLLNHPYLHFLREILVTEDEGLVGDQPRPITVSHFFSHFFLVLPARVGNHGVAARVGWRKRIGWVRADAGYGKRLILCWNCSVSDKGMLCCIAFCGVFCVVLCCHRCALLCFVLSLWQSLFASVFASLYLSLCVCVSVFHPTGHCLYFCLLLSFFVVLVWTCCDLVWLSDLHFLCVRFYLHVYLCVFLCTLSFFSFLSFVSFIWFPSFYLTLSLPFIT